MNATATGGAILRAILERPDDDLARLAYADWLEEEGETALPKFIRDTLENPGMFAEAESLGGEWSVRGRNGWPQLADAMEAGLPARVPSGAVATFRRGFVESVRLTCAAFLAHAESIFRQHPVTHVTLTDKSPHPWNDLPDCKVYGWVVCESGADLRPARLPPALFFQLPQAKDRYGFWWRRFPAGDRQVWGAHPADTSMRHLSSACVGYGRGLAGLPPLDAPRESRE